MCVTPCVCCNKNFAVLSMSGEAFDWSRHTAANTPRLDAKGVRGVARIVGIHDGDTVKALVRIPWAGGAVRMVTLRLAGIDAPELKTGEAGAHSTARLVRWLCGHHPGDVGACEQNERSDRSYIFNFLMQE